MSGQIISCQTHDYIEIACIYGYRLQLTLDNGEIIEGQALTTLTSGKQEFLVIHQQRDQQQRIELNRIKTMQALTANPHFERIDF